MKLSTTALQIISQPTVRLRLAMALGFREHYITTLTKKNKENGPLTTVAAIRVIQEASGFTESEILVHAEAMAA